MPKWARDEVTDRTIRTKTEDKFLAWDIETARTDIPEGDDLMKHVETLGIACVGTLTSDGILRTWNGLLDRMAVQQCRKLAEYLLEMSGQGYTIVSWNGVSFDFRVLAVESGMWKTCRRLAWDHVDGMFHFFCQEGVAVGLQAAARGLGLEGKSGSGRNAPAMWAAGKREEVLAYVSQDVRVTLNVIQEIQKKGRMDWIAKSGRLMTYRLPKKRLLTVKEAMKLPLPDTSWMREPWERSKFTGWLSV